MRQEKYAEVVEVENTDDMEGLIEAIIQAMPLRIM